MPECICGYDGDYNRYVRICDIDIFRCPKCDRKLNNEGCE